ncbi:hypothetical protein [Allorhodopirellula heiligendammensis]|nr:hypothetical protein [Allorhodopirellula heiligendammensis]
MTRTCTKKVVELRVFQAMICQSIQRWSAGFASKATEVRKAEMVGDDQ